MNYSLIYQECEDFLKSRKGLANPAKKTDFPIFVRELAGLIAGIAHQHDIEDYDVIHFLRLAKSHSIKPVDISGNVKDVRELIDERITSLPLYNYMEYDLMYFKPGRTQVGPGEFFLCFFDESSEFGIDNQAGYDIQVDEVATELKKHGSNFTDPKMFDKYEQSGDVQRLMVIKPVSNVKKPIKRSSYACVDFRQTSWKHAFGHRGKAGTLHYLLD